MRQRSHGLYAAGDVAGGCPQKYVTGALAEGELAALDIVKKLTDQDAPQTFAESGAAEEVIKGYEAALHANTGMYTIEELEEAMQKVMDEYAGGISANYQFNEKQLDLGGREDRKTGEACRGSCGWQYA